MSSILFHSRVLVESPLFTLRASRKPHANSSDSVLRNPYHPLYQRTVARSNERCKQLNQYYVVPLAVHKKSCVRSRIRRRIHEATRLALAEFGYKLDGTPLDGKGSDGAKKILGTLAYFPQYKAVSADWTTLQDEVRRGVAGFMKLHQDGLEVNKERRMRAWQGENKLNVKPAEKTWKTGTRPSEKPKHYKGGGTRGRKYPAGPDEQGRGEGNGERQRSYNTMGGDGGKGGGYRRGDYTKGGVKDRNGNERTGEYKLDLKKNTFTKEPKDVNVRGPAIRWLKVSDRRNGFNGDRRSGMI